MKKRTFGKDNIFLPPITLGTMRFSAERIGSLENGVSLLRYLYNNGINAYHTSHEYEAHPFFSEVFREFKKRDCIKDTVHIVKIACPHFEESDFSFAQLKKKIEEQLKVLNIDSIDIVQWLFRQKNNIDEVRIPKLEASFPEIASAFKQLKKEGMVNSFSCFPYSMNFADVINRSQLSDGFVDYLNIIERDWVEKLTQFNNVPSFIAIRPLFAGKTLAWINTHKTFFSQFLGEHFTEEEAVRWSLSYPLLSPSVSSSILSISNQAQADIAISVQSNLEENDIEFKKISSILAQETARKGDV